MGGVGALNLYHNLFYFAKWGEEGSGWLANCEELVGVTHRRWEVGHFVEIDHTNGDPLEAPRFSNRRVLIRSAVTGRSSACWSCLDVHDTLLIKN